MRTRAERIGELLHQYAWLWRPIAYKEPTPRWVERAPALTAELGSLNDAQLQVLSSNDSALTELMTRHIPELHELWALSELPKSLSSSALTAEFTVDAPFIRDIPGRKWEQIDAFARATSHANMPVLDWCGGKGHLGRLLARAWQCSVTTLERDADLCAQGAALASKTKQTQNFVALDVMSLDAETFLQNRHGVALHACGELHRQLVRATVSSQAAALDLSPCCYYHQANDLFEPLSVKTLLQLTRDDLRLAVTETVTSSARVIRLRDQEMAWKLGYDLLRRHLEQQDIYRPQKPIPKAWLSLTFKAFCGMLAEREHRVLADEMDWADYEQQGWRRQRETMRCSLARLAFRRPIEVFLAYDLALYLCRHNYAVQVKTFCARSVTPRNILISARRIVRT